MKNEAEKSKKPLQKKYGRMLDVLLLCGILFTFCMPFPVYAGSSHTVKKSASKSLLTGICLDCSNRYYSVKTIKKYIRLAHSSGHGYLQLHLTGDKNIGVECRTLGQIPQRKYRRRQSEYYNPKTKRSFLTRGQIRSILAYARKQKVMVVPEIDMPGHTRAFAKLYQLKYGKKATSRIFDPNSDNSLRINSPKAIKTAEKIYGEYTGLFSNCRYFHIGCDEFWSGNDKENAKYINQISSYVKKKGFQVWIWNDLITNRSVNFLHRNLTVTYWSWDGDTENKKEQTRRRKNRASFSSLQKKGFNLLNYNSYYLYYVPKTSDTKKDAAYMVNDLKRNWNIRKWDGERGENVSSLRHIKGAAVSVWNEDSKKVSSSLLYRNTSSLYRVFVSKCRVKTMR